MHLRAFELSDGTFDNYLASAIRGRMNMGYDGRWVLVSGEYYGALPAVANFRLRFRCSQSQTRSYSTTIHQVLMTMFPDIRGKYV